MTASFMQQSMVWFIAVAVVMSAAAVASYNDDQRRDRVDSTLQVPPRICAAQPRASPDAAIIRIHTASSPAFIQRSLVLESSGDYEPAMTLLQQARAPTQAPINAVPLSGQRLMVCRWLMISRRPRLQRCRSRKRLCRPLCRCCPIAPSCSRHVLLASRNV